MPALLNDAGKILHFRVLGIQPAGLAQMHLGSLEVSLLDGKFRSQQMQTRFVGLKAQCLVQRLLTLVEITRLVLIGSQG